VCRVLPVGRTPQKPRDPGVGRETLGEPVGGRLGTPPLLSVEDVVVMQIGVHVHAVSPQLFGTGGVGGVARLVREREALEPGR
jgi:hypothetical protein